MNVSSISSSLSFQTENIEQNRQDAKLTDEQKDLVAYVLEGYSSNSLSEEDAVAIASAFHVAGIPPSKDLAKTISDSGFKVHEIGELSGILGGSGLPEIPEDIPSPPSLQNNQEENTIFDFFKTVFNIQESKKEEPESSNNIIPDSGFKAHEIAELFGVAGSSGVQEPPGNTPLSQSSYQNNQEENSISDILKTVFNTQGSKSEESESSNNTISDYSSRIISLNDVAKSEVMDLFESYSLDNTDLSREDANSVITNSLGQILNDSNNYRKVTYFYA